MFGLATIPVFGSVFGLPVKQQVKQQAHLGLLGSTHELGPGLGFRVKHARTLATGPRSSSVLPKHAATQVKQQAAAATGSRASASSGKSDPVAAGCCFTCVVACLRSCFTCVVAALLAL